MTHTPTLANLHDPAMCPALSLTGFSAPFVLGTAYAGAYGPRVDTGIASIGLLAKNVTSGACLCP